MADDTTKKIGNLTESTKTLAQGADSVSDALRRMGVDVRPVSEHLKNFETRMREANKEQLTWAKLMATSRDTLRKYKDEMFGAEASMRKLTGRITRMGDTIKSNIKLMDAWKGQVDIIRKGQEDLSKATYLHTGDIGRANAALQKSIDGVRRTNDNARKAAWRYGEEITALNKVFAEAKTRFEGQLQATGNYEKSLDQLQDRVYLISKSMGVDASKAMDYMQSRMETGGKTLDAVQQETILVAKATDAYVASMRKIPDVAKSAYMSQGMLLEQLKKVGEVMGPLVNNEMWSKLLTNLDVFGRKAGLSAQETAKMQGDTIKFMESMQKADLSNLWAVQASRKAQQSGLIEDLKKTGDDQTKRRMATLEKILASDQPEIKKMQATIAALKGETRFQQMAMESFSTTGDRAVQLQQMESMGFDPLSAQVALDAMSKGGAIHEALEKSATEQKATLTKSEEANAFLSEMRTLAEERMKPQSETDKAMLNTAQALDAIQQFLKTSLIAQFGKLAVNLAVLGVQAATLWKLYKQDEERNDLLQKQLDVLNRGGGDDGGPDIRRRSKRKGKRSRRRGKRPSASTKVQARRGGRRPSASTKGGMLRSLGGMALGGLGLDMLPPGVDTALDVGGTALDVASAAKPGAAAAKGGAGAAKGAGWMAKLGKGAGWAARTGGKRALGLLGPAGLVAGAGLVGFGLGRYAGKHLGNFLSDVAHGDAEKQTTKEHSELQQRIMNQAVGAGLRKVDIEELKKIKDPEERTAALISMIRAGMGQSGKGDIFKALGDVVEGKQKFLTSTDFDAQMNERVKRYGETAKIREMMAALGISKEALVSGAHRQDIYGPDTKSPTENTADALSAYVAKMRTHKDKTGQLLPEQNINALRESRQQQQQISMSMDNASAQQTGELQDGKFNPTNKSMTYTLPGQTLSFNLETLGAGVYAAYRRPEST